ncbi:hypothetical protein O2K51_13495 [Apibacter raozihei]|uniref:hypothetical protein n=1 Tax=Apibacter TaxID=1778601 RepID=UPI000FE314DB|nr:MULTISPECIES: hypothetical protein [Apibacter]
MEIVVQIVMGFIVFNSIIKLSFWKWWQTGIFSLAAGVFILLSYPYAIQQSKVQITEFLNNNIMMQDTAVLVTIESAVCIAFCFVSLNGILKNKTNKWQRILGAYPSILLFPVLFYVETQAIFIFTGENFLMITMVVAIAVCLLINIGSLLIKKLIPENELRLEMHFLIGLITAFAGLIVTVNEKVVYQAVEEPLNLKHLAYTLTGLFFALIIGFYGNKISWILKSRKIKKEN